MNWVCVNIGSRCHCRSVTRAMPVVNSRRKVLKGRASTSAAFLAAGAIGAVEHSGESADGGCASESGRFDDNFCPGLHSLLANAMVGR